MNSSYKDLLVWRRAMELVLEIYRCTKTFPREETYGLVAQMRRAAVSITEQYRRGQGTLHAQGAHILLLNARGSLLELETQAMIAEKLGYLSKGDATELASRSAEIGRLLNGLIYRFKEAATRD